MAAIYGEVTVWEGTSPIVVRARLTRASDSGVLLQADGSAAVPYAIFDEDSATPEVDLLGGSATVLWNTVVLAALEPGEGWQKGGGGFSFRHSVADAALTAAPGKRRIEHTLTDDSGEVHRVVTRVKVLPTHNG